MYQVFSLPYMRTEDDLTEIAASLLILDSHDNRYRGPMRPKWPITY
jgi:hypothetical protein